MASSFSFEGFVIGQREWKEKDKLLTVFTKKRGKLLILAKGVRRIDSKRLGILDTGSLVKGKAFGEIGRLVLGDVDLIFQPLKLRKNLILNGGLLSICSLVSQLLPEGEGNEAVFELLFKTIKRLEEKRDIEVVVFFEVELLNLLGFGAPKGIHGVLQKKDLAAAQRMIDDYLNQILERKVEGLSVFIANEEAD
jgi:DNA repair protein RecO (recombination protein O)